MMLLLRATRSLNFKSTPLCTTQKLKYSDEKKPPTEDAEAENLKSKDNKESAANKLNKLLASMQTDENITLIKKIDITKAGGRAKQKVNKDKLKKADDKPKNIFEAAKNVANEIDAGDKHQKRQTESELLSKLLSHIDSSTAGEISSSTDSKSAEFNLNDIIVGMKIDRKPAHIINKDKGMAPSVSRSQFVRKTIGGRQQSFDDKSERPKQFRKKLTQAVPYTSSVNLFGEEPLGIFKDPNALKDSPDMLKTWNYLFERELKLTVARPPRNYFEKMTLWTDQGKLWKFPIDNEQGLENEKKVDFSEHIFLEQHLEGWCPTKGPVRHFMELVCVGLSKNPYITAQEKRDHILWYQDYFEQKKESLKDIIIQEKDSSSNKEIKSS